jgi:DNA-binding PadR family transcriptional regulator
VNQLDLRHASRAHQRGPHERTRNHHRDPRFGPGGMPLGWREMFARGGRGRGRPIRRGEIRPLILALLTRKPMHGYEIIQLLEAQSGGRWRPSAGSVYPTLQQLADEGLVTSEEVDGRRTYTLTDAGREAAADAPAPPNWGDLDREDDQDLRKLGMQLIQAVMQVQQVGSAHARQETNRVLADARRRIYRLLAEDEDLASEADPGGNDGEAPPA